MQGEGLAGYPILHFDRLQEIAIRRNEIGGSGEDSHAGHRCGVVGLPLLEWQLKGQSARIPSETGSRYRQCNAFTGI